MLQEFRNKTFTYWLFLSPNFLAFHCHFSVKFIHPMYKEMGSRMAGSKEVDWVMQTVLAKSASVTTWGNSLQQRQSFALNGGNTTQWSHVHLQKKTKIKHTKYYEIREGWILQKKKKKTYPFLCFLCMQVRSQSCGEWSPRELKWGHKCTNTYWSLPGTKRKCIWKERMPSNECNLCKEQNRVKKTDGCYYKHY